MIDIEELKNAHRQIDLKLESSREIPAQLRPDGIVQEVEDQFSALLNTVFAKDNKREAISDMLRGLNKEVEGLMDLTVSTEDQLRKWIDLESKKHVRKALQ